MTNKIKYSLVAAILATSLNANEDFASAVIKSSSIITTEKDAMYATEIYTQKDLENSNATDVFDFLAMQTSIVVSANSGNTFSQKLDMRGYGVTDGYQNLVITVNGRRLNNIDMVPQLLSSISLDSIQRIEIFKGTGSVEFGDGANAGVINIITNGKNKNYIKTYLGNDGREYAALSLGHYGENFIINGYADYTSTDGSRIKLSTGDKDSNFLRNKNLIVRYFPSDDLEVGIKRSYSNMNIKYGSYVTLNNYNTNPNETTSLTHQEFSTYSTEGFIDYSIDEKLSLDINYNNEDKSSAYVGYDPTKYDYKSFAGSLNYKDNLYKITLGIDGFNGDRIESSNTTTKDNLGIFVSGKYKLNDRIEFSSGYRKENINYNYAPNGSANLEDKYKLNASDFGLNYKLSDSISLFTNFNKSFQAPDIDRFFKWKSDYSGLEFNSFINPAKVKTFNIGMMNIQNNNKFKITAFRSNLKDEIYLYKINDNDLGNNRNIDKSHKYGLEIFNKYKINNDYYTSINYNYIIAKIDEENEASGTYNNKYLPGVSKHNIVLNLGFDVNNYSGVLLHTYRSEAYAMEDFDNTNIQKQKAYNSTDLTLKYRYKDYEFFGKVTNLFDVTNGSWLRDDVIYLTNFERTYYAGIKVKF